MGFEEFLGEEEETIAVVDEKVAPIEKITSNQVYDVITSRQPDWQVIIYDLINSEQLDPWDVDIIVLTNKYFEKIFQMEQDPDFYISSKVLLAASLLLRIKSEFLINKYIRSIDEILFGRKEEVKKELEHIEIDRDELPLLIPKTPLPRLRKITLPQLMEALNTAINTETRRIKRELSIKRAHHLSHVDIPAFRRIDIKDRIREFYARILTAIKKESADKISYLELVGVEREQKIASFLPLLYLSNTKKLWLEQEKHLDDISIYLYKYFEDNKDRLLGELEQDIEELKSEIAAVEEAENLDDKKSGLEIAQEKLREKKRLQEDVKKELEAELGIVEELAKEVIEIEEKEKSEDRDSEEKVE
ncbi:MAG: hypothetical protein RL557_685 [archaeon]|jgi:segregation and condensation protein A